MLTPSLQPTHPRVGFFYDFSRSTPILFNQCSTVLFNVAEQSMDTSKAL